MVRKKQTLSHEQVSKRGGKGRWKGTTKKQRSDFMSAASRARWDKNKKEKAL